MLRAPEVRRSIGTAARMGGLRGLIVLAGVHLTTIPLSLLFVLAGRHLVRGIIAGAVKG